MIKILHSADWHLDSAFVGRTPEQAAMLRKALLQVPEKLARLCLDEGCDLVLLSGDLFDGPHSAESFRAVFDALRDMSVPVFISPGNHDFCSPSSPYLTELWPENVHIFTRSVMESVAVPGLDCRIYGAGYQSMDCPGLMEGFCADGSESVHIGILHGDPTQKNSPYCPITDSQIRRSGLDYLALGHIHKEGSQFLGSTLCAWPGCPMGRGFDELEEKGALIVTINPGQKAAKTFIPLPTPRFYRFSVMAGYDPLSALSGVLPAVGSEDLYQIELTGESAGVDIGALCDALSRFPNLELKDRTVPETDIWASVGEDSLEGLFFGSLKAQFDAAGEEDAQTILLSARIARQLLDGQEVVLP